MYIPLPVAALQSLTDTFSLPKNNYRMDCNQIYIHLLVPALDTLTKGQDTICLPKNNYVYGL